MEMILMGKLSIRREHFMYSYNKFAPQNLTFQMHHYYEILYFTSGSAKYIIDGTEYEAEAGDIFITRPEELHSIVFTGDEEYERHFVQFDREFASSLSATLIDNFDSAARRRKISAREAEKHGIDNFFNEIRECVIKKPAEFETVMQTYIIQLIAAICGLAEKPIEPPTAASKKTQKIKQYISQNFTRNLSLDEIAEHVFFNKYHMCHIFKAETGMTVKEYIELSRFMYARKLHYQGKKMSEIASLCGYSDYSLFYKNFTKYSGGKSPKEFFAMNNSDDVLE